MGLPGKYLDTRSLGLRGRPQLKAELWETRVGVAIVTGSDGRGEI